MKQGSLEERYLENGIWKVLNQSKSQGNQLNPEDDPLNGQYNQHKSPDNQLNKRGIHRIFQSNSTPHIGSDFSVSEDVIATEGSGESPDIAWCKAGNNFACSLGDCLGARIHLFLPTRTKESNIKNAMERFACLSKRDGIPILGGNSEVLAGLENIIYEVSLIGRCRDDAAGWSRKALGEQADIIMIGYAGVLGTNLLAAHHREELEKKYAIPLLENLLFTKEEYSIWPFMRDKSVYIDNPSGEVLYIHDISYGGVYSALWQLGSWSGRGLLVDNRKILVKQTTIEVCEGLNQNPYLIDGTGAVLLLCREGDCLVREIKKRKGTDYPIAVIGHLTRDGERRIFYGDGEFRTLTPVQGGLGV